MIWHKLIGRTKAVVRSLGKPSQVLSVTPSANSPLDLAELEDRILMSATPMAPDAMADADVDEPVDAEHALMDAAHMPMAPDADHPALAPDADASSVDIHASLSELGDLAQHADDAGVTQHDRHELVFVDTSLDGYQELLYELLQHQSDSDQFDVILLDSHQDGLEQISHTLEHYDQLDAVHFISHASDGAVKLGNVWLDAGQLHAHAGDIATWGDALTSDADLLFYGCNLAATAEGQTIMNGLSALTGADVAASVDVTGHHQLGGDWDLEYTVGHVEASVLLTGSAQHHWLHILSSETVRDNFDTDSYSGNNGTTNWAGDWQEIGEADGALAGSVHVVARDLSGGSSNSLSLHAVDGIGAYREVDLSGASAATLSYDWQRHDVDGFSGSTLDVQVSNNGGTDWVTLHSIGDGTDLAALSASFNLTPYLAPDTQIRFLATGTGTGSTLFDNIVIDYETAAIGPPLPPENHSPVLSGEGPMTLTAILEDAVDNNGNTVAEILASAGDDRITDLDPGAVEGIAVTGVNNTDGTWQYDPQADGNWHAFGRVSNLSSVLLAADSRIRFVPNTDYFGSGGNIDFHGWDQTSGNSGDAGVDVSANGGVTAFSATGDTATITVQAVNDAPQLTLPGAQSVNEDVPLAISGIAIDDVDVAAGDLQVTLSVDHGALTFGDTTGLSFTTGDGSDDANVTFTGQIDAVNAALATLSYQGQLNYNGADQLSVTVNDQGNTGAVSALSDTGTVDIAVQAVNDAPQLTLPGAQSVNEDVPLAISGIAIDDVDVAAGDLQVTLSVDHGALTFGDTTGLTFTTGDGSDDANVTFTGQVDAVNAALATLSYQGQLNYNGADQLSVTVNDQGNTGAVSALSDTGTVDIAVQAVNDAPQLTLPGAQSVNEDVPLAISGIAIDDVDVAAGDLQVTLSVGHGALTFGDTTGLTFTTGDGSDDANVTFTGQVDAVNAALATLSYQGQLNYNGADQLSVTVNDQGNTGAVSALSDTGTVDIAVLAVNDAPQLTLPGAQSVNEDVPLAISGIAIDDVDVAAGDLQVTLSVGHGALTFGDTTGLTFTTGDGSDDANVTFTGQVDAVNAALATLSYQGQLNYNGADQLSVTVNDQGNTGAVSALSDTGTVDIAVQAVNDAPQLTLPGAQSVNEDVPLAISGIAIDDVDVAAGDLQVTLSVDHGALTFGDTTGLTFTTGDGSDDANVTFTGQVDAVNAALATLSYQGQLNYNGADQLSVTVNDQGNTGAVSALSDTGTVDIAVQAVNDAPQLTLPGAQSVNEDVPLAISGIAIDDVDVAAGDLQVTLSVDHGALTFGDTTGLTFTTGDGSDDANVTFTGQVDAVNAALATLSYQGQLNYNGADQLSVTVNDQGNTGAVSALFDTGTVDIAVQAVNDAPQLTLPGAQSVNEDVPLAISGIAIDDVDVAAGDLQVTLSVDHGR